MKAGQIKMNQKSYDKAIKEVDRLMRIQPELSLDSPKGRRLDKLVDQIVAYEKKRWPIGKPSKTKRLVIKDGEPYVNLKYVRKFKDPVIKEMADNLHLLFGPRVLKKLKWRIWRTNG